MFVALLLHIALVALLHSALVLALLLLAVPNGRSTCAGGCDCTIIHCDFTSATITTTVLWRQTCFRSNECIHTLTNVISNYLKHIDVSQFVIER